MGKIILLSPPPYQSPISGNQPISPEWQQWFQQMYLRAGGVSALSNIDLSNVEATQPLTQKIINSNAQTIYTSPTGLNTVIDSLSVKNIGNIASTITVYIVPFGAEINSTNQLVSNLSISPGVTTPITSAVSQVLGSEATIVCTADSPNILNVSVSGRQVS